MNPTFLLIIIVIAMLNISYVQFYLILTAALCDRSFFHPHSVDEKLSLRGIKVIQVLSGEQGYFTPNTLACAPCD